MTLAAFGAHQLAATRYMKTALCPFMSFEFWHLFLSP
jgi:hypothetical protein